MLQTKSTGFTADFFYTLFVICKEGIVIDCYVESSLLLSSVLMLSSCCIVSFIFGWKIRLKSCLFFAFFLSLAELVVFFGMNGFAAFLIEAICLFVFCRRRARYLLTILLSRTFLLILAANWVEGEIVGGIVYVPVFNRSWKALLILLLAVDYVLIKERRATLYKSELRRRIVLKTGKNMIQMNGYLDTGNKGTDLQIPIIILNESFFKYFDGVAGKELQLGSIRSCWKQTAYPCELSIEGGAYQKVLAVFSDQLKNIDCLLNIHNF